MDRKEQLINALRNELSGESALILENNIRKRTITADIDSSEIRFHIDEFGEIYREDMKCCCPRSFRSVILRTILALIVIIPIGGLLFYFGGRFLSNIFDLNLSVSYLILITTALIIYLVIKLVKYVYSIFDNKINSIQPRSVEVKDDYNDDVYFIISSTYETLCDFRKERERQAKNSFNVALSLVIVGVLIVFGGVFLLFKKNIVEGVLSSTVGSISSIIGGTIIKLYKDTNDRMDKLNANLSTLNYAKVQYALILKINDEKKRDIELSMLIKSIGKIQK